jgi:hypothetical protein
MMEIYPNMLTWAAKMSASRKLGQSVNEIRLDKTPGWKLVHEEGDWTICHHDGAQIYLMEHSHETGHYFLTGYDGQCYSCNEFAPKELRVQYSILRMGQPEK